MQIRLHLQRSLGVALPRCPDVHVDGDLVPSRKVERQPGRHKPAVVVRRRGVWIAIADPTERLDRLQVAIPRQVELVRDDELRAEEVARLAVLIQIQPVIASHHAGLHMRARFVAPRLDVAPDSYRVIGGVSGDRVSEIVGRNVAFEELKSELKRYGRDVEVYTERKDFASIIVNFEAEEELDYSIEVMISPVRVFPRPVIHHTEWASSRRLRVEGLLRKGSQDYDISDISKEEIIEHFLDEYKNYIEFEY